MYSDGAGLRRYGVINQLVETEYDVERVAEVKRRFLQLKGCMSIEDFFSGWFHGAPAETIKRGNVEDFVAYGFYFRTLEGLPSEVHPYTFRGLTSAAIHATRRILLLTSMVQALHTLEYHCSCFVHRPTYLVQGSCHHPSLPIAGATSHMHHKTKAVVVMCSNVRAAATGGVGLRGPDRGGVGCEVSGGAQC